MRRYWLLSAIAAVFSLVWSAVLPLFPPRGLALQSVQAVHPPAISTTGASATIIAQQASGGITASAQDAVAELASARVADASPAQGHLEQGKLAYGKEHFAVAAQQFQQAVQRSQSLGQAQALSYLSLAQQELGQWDAAQSAVTQSLELAQGFPTSRKQQLVLGRAFNTQGSLYFARGKAQAALEAWQQAEAAYIAGKDRTRQLGSLLNQAQAFQSLGYYGRARNILEGIELQLKRQPEDFQLTGRKNLGGLYWRIGELQKSEENLGKAATLAQKLEDQAQQGAILVSLGNTEQAQNKTEQALQHYAQAAELGSGEVAFQADLNRFRLLVRTQQAAAAQGLIPVLQEQLAALPLSRTLLYGGTNFADGLTRLAFAPESQESIALAAPSKTIPTKTHRGRNRQHQNPPSLGLVPDKISLIDGRTQAIAPSFPSPNLPDAPPNSLARQQAQFAVDTLAWVVDSAEALGDIRALTYGQGYLGHLYELDQQWETAQDCTQKALAQSERIQAKDIDYQWQWQSARIHEAQAQELAGDEQAHLQAAKESYYKSFDILQSLRSDLVAIQPELQFSFREQVEPVYRQFADLLLRLDDDLPRGSEASQATLKLAREVLNSLQIAELNNFFHAACIQDQQLELDKIERSDTAALYPIIFRDRLSVILSLPGEPLRHYSADVDQAEVEKTLEVFRDNLELAFSNDEAKDAGDALYGWLIQPIAAMLKEKQIKTLTFVLDGALRNVPMAALYDRASKHYLVQDYSIALTPRLKLFEPKPLNLRKILLAGVSEETSEGLDALPYVEKELRQISKIVPSKLLLNGAFTRKALETNVKKSPFSVLHLATHGQFSSNLEETFILAWDGPVPVAQLNAALRGRDRPDPIELLVLSACETAYGDERAALGLAGVAVQAGARSTLASLWNVDDQSGAEFAQLFYRALKDKGMSRAEALREAQVTMLESGKYRPPVNWASYVLVGSWL